MPQVNIQEADKKTVGDQGKVLAEHGARQMETLGSNELPRALSTPSVGLGQGQSIGNR
jgi:hypothetical protein